MADLDKNSKVDAHEWKSMLRYGELSRDSNGSYSITLGKEVRKNCMTSRDASDWQRQQTELKSQINEAGRSMELSELVTSRNSHNECWDAANHTIIFDSLY